MFRTLLAVIALWLVPLSAAAVPTAEELHQQLERVRAEAGLVALGAVVADADGNILGLAVTGERRNGSGDPAQPEDAWHIGSNTKMLTALLYGRLVEQGEAEWGATLPELFPDLASGMDPAWRGVTIEDLFAHRSGLAPNPGALWFLTSRASKASLPAQRSKLAAGFLFQSPRGETGDFAYSNLGYMIAGAAIDRIARRLGQNSYEDLFLSMLIPDGEGWGFGPPPEGIEGHVRGLFGKMKAAGKGPEADNPPGLGPAGTLHVPLAAHARLLSRFLTPDATQSRLLAPYPDDASHYALGWGVTQLDGFGRVYGHNGSNTMWLSAVLLVPEAGLVVIVNTNSYTEEGSTAVNALSRDLVALYAPGG
ncbi:MAG: serine hydrolase domain-containing protein [Hyphomonas sp.]|uniref:serine hydrolase domain-containing protein n=1 Tax=Hyphomonas sp. TaxID=87 RepID=UPI003526E872